VPNRITNNNPYVQIILSVLLGTLIGFLTFLFVKALFLINETQGKFNAEVPYHLLLAPLVLTFLFLIKRNTLYFPYKVSELHYEVSSHYWSWVMFPVHFLGPILSHATGMSLGREGAVVLFSSGIVRLLKLSWSFWGPILASIGFSSVLGNYWVAPVFMAELFSHTNSIQKLCGFAGAIAAVTVGQQMGMPHLFLPFEISDELGFFAKFGLFTVFALGAGYIMRYYKTLHLIIVARVQKTGIVWPVVISILMAVFLYLPEFRGYQSLGLSSFHDLQSSQFSFSSSFIKLAFTLVCTSIGFLGGEFIPMVFAGVNWGGALFHALGADSVLGAAFGAFILFAAGTRLKWTSFFLMAFLLGWSWMLWIFFVLTISLNFAGEHSLYQKHRH
jgi:H+/Cl- antiporter ClcA